MTGSVEELPERFFRLPRIRFLLILCKEIFRINRWGWVATWEGRSRPLVCCLGALTSCGWATSLYGD